MRHTIPPAKFEVITDQKSCSFVALHEGPPIIRVIETGFAGIRQAQIIQDALNEYCDKHGLAKGYFYI
jgi:hypothetical protein